MTTQNVNGQNSKRVSITQFARRIATCIAMGGLVAGCTETMYRHTTTKIGMSDTVQLSQVTAAIQDAGNVTRWRTRVVRPGLIEAKREWGGGKHNIVVDVIYTTKNYKIVYKDSKNLKYNGRTIHRAYGEQVGAFDKAIKARTWNM